MMNPDGLDGNRGAMLSDPSNSADFRVGAVIEYLGVLTWWQRILYALEPRFLRRTWWWYRMKRRVHRFFAGSKGLHVVTSINRDSGTLTTRAIEAD